MFLYVLSCNILSVCAVVALTLLHDMIVFFGYAIPCTVDLWLFSYDSWTFPTIRLGQWRNYSKNILCARTNIVLRKGAEFPVSTDLGSRRHFFYKRTVPPPSRTPPSSCLGLRFNSCTFVLFSNQVRRCWTEGLASILYARTNVCFIKSRHKVNYHWNCSA